MLYLCLDGAVLAGHEREIVVTVYRWKNPVCALFAYDFQSHHERGVSGTVVQLSRQLPLITLPSDIGGGFYERLG